MGCLLIKTRAANIQKWVNVIKMPGENNGEMKDGTLGTKHRVLTWVRVYHNMLWLFS